jgi:hypothetical protein
VSNDRGREHGIQPSLRQRVIERMGKASDALEAASAGPVEALDNLDEAVDMLMRALARVLIETARQRGRLNVGAPVAGPALCAAMMPARNPKVVGRCPTSSSSRRPATRPARR